MSGTGRVKSLAERLTGKSKEATGKLADNPRTRDKGKAKQAKADLKSAGRNLKKATKH